MIEQRRDRHPSRTWLPTTLGLVALVVGITALYRTSTTPRGTWQGPFSLTLTLSQRVVEVDESVVLREIIEWDRDAFEARGVELVRYVRHISRQAPPDWHPPENPDGTFVLSTNTNLPPCSSTIQAPTPDQILGGHGYTATEFNSDEPGEFFISVEWHLRDRTGLEFVARSSNIAHLTVCERNSSRDADD